ncbi:ribbon-helix-helix protein, CopG family [Rhodococcus sp. NPDC049939]|uniref:plasmid mobilization protein n=1 Tax=Rhodococcus sp. NPDC049939 TaxID=3155511 RepID=UPI0033FA249A
MSGGRNLRKGKRHTVHAFLTDEEKEALVERSKALGLSQSATIRQLIMNAHDSSGPA